MNLPTQFVLSMVYRLVRINNVSSSDLHVAVTPNDCD